jgi:hypothetical protein
MHLSPERAPHAIVDTSDAKVSGRIGLKGRNRYKKQKLQANLAAICPIDTLNAEGRHTTPEEQQVLGR